MTDASTFAPIRNGGVLSRDRIPRLSLADFQQVLRDAVAREQRVAALFGDSRSADSGVDLYAVIADAPSGLLKVGMTSLETDVFPSLTPECPQVHLFEREIAEQYGVLADGHPWFKPVRFHRSYRPTHDAWGRTASPVVGVTDYYRVDGEEIHEVGVGPVHAGIIEPGHFRFQCHGEEVYHLEISLGYQHRGVERSLIGGPNKRTVFVMEALAGDSTVGHTTAYCQAIEALSGCQVPIRAEVLRAMALELERLANHTGDLGALANDVGFLPTASYCGRIRGDFLNLTALLCGNRFARCLVRPGGVAFDADGDRLRQIRQRLETALRDVAGAAELLWNAASVQARFEGTGPVSLENCIALGMVGPAARACGLEIDVRRDFPSGFFRFALLPISTADNGDVFARAYVRWMEIQRSCGFIRDQLKGVPDGPIVRPVAHLLPNHLTVSLVEGWRGEICHVVLTDQAGRFARYKIVDPSFHNWTGLALALRDQQISDFPLCNKSFNLSYCGHDL